MWAAVSYLVTALVFIVLGLTVNSIYFAVALKYSESEKMALSLFTFVGHLFLFC